MAAALQLLAACDKASAPKPSPPTAPVVHVDVAAVERWIDLPAVRSVRWIEEPRESAGGRLSVPGPTDSVLTAYVELDAGAWPALEAKVGAPTGTTTLRMSEARAVLLFPAPLLTTLPRDGNEVAVEVLEYDVSALRKGTRQGHVARRVGEGLLISFFTT